MLMQYGNTWKWLFLLTLTWMTLVFYFIYLFFLKCARMCVTRGVLAIAWSLADPELLLSCGKDNRILCWNPNTAEVSYSPDILTSISPQTNNFLWLQLPYALNCLHTVHKLNQINNPQNLAEGHLCGDKAENIIKLFCCC